MIPLTSMSQRRHALPFSIAAIVITLLSMPAVSGTRTAQTLHARHAMLRAALHRYAHRHSPGAKVFAPIPVEADDVEIDDDAAQLTISEIPSAFAGVHAATNVIAAAQSVPSWSAHEDGSAPRAPPRHISA